MTKTLPIKTAGALALALLAAVPAKTLTLDPVNGVYPKIFSPNGDNRNDVVNICLDNPNLAGFFGVVIDMSGAEVADLVDAGPNAACTDRMVWDGRDRNGRVVPAGLYLYKIEGSGSTVSGVVAVAL